MSKCKEAPIGTIEVSIPGRWLLSCAHHWIEVVEEEIKNYPREPWWDWQRLHYRESLAGRADSKTRRHGKGYSRTVYFTVEQIERLIEDVEMDYENTFDTEPYCESCSHYDCVQDRGRDYWRRKTYREMIDRYRKQLGGKPNEQ